MQPQSPRRCLTFLNGVQPSARGVRAANQGVVVEDRGHTGVAKQEVTALAVAAAIVKENVAVVTSYVRFHKGASYKNVFCKNNQKCVY